jgi:hypothetical protein
VGRWKFGWRPPGLVLWVCRPRFWHSRQLLGLPSSRLRVCCRFGLRLLRSGPLPDGGYFRLFGRLRRRLNRWMFIWGWSGGGLDTHPTDDLIPPLAQVHLLGRGPGPLSFRSGWVACGVHSVTLGRLLCKSRLRLFPLNSVRVVRRVVSPANTSLRLFLRGRASTGKVGAPTRDAPGRVSAVTLRVSKALAALTLQWSFWSHI